MAKIDCDLVERLLYSYYIDTFRPILPGSLKFDGGHDLNTADIFYDAAARRVALKIKQIQEMNFSCPRLKHRIQISHKFAKNFVLVVYKRLDK